ncbi:hypothetical protein BpHYR1_023915 [Brachionus plicatilis]|uniref:Uncharacterized protein n=1 Tax=Brachionus plicatilis TaxID=10195 RepID=A0A3M7R6H3_BRAPC|nr:hypothetical protein BpHYR1_023915 [Brachionus plicatilis]
MTCHKTRKKNSQIKKFCSHKENQKNLKQKEEMSIQELKNFVTYSLPKSLAYLTDRDTYCGYCFNNELQRHKAKQQLRKCDADVNCTVKYRSIICETRNVCSIAQKYEHCHDIYDSYISLFLNELNNWCIETILHRQKKILWYVLMSTFSHQNFEKDAVGLFQE